MAVGGGGGGGGGWSWTVTTLDKLSQGCVVFGVLWGMRQMWLSVSVKTGLTSRCYHAVNGQDSIQIIPEVEQFLSPSTELTLVTHCLQPTSLPGASYQRRVDRLDWKPEVDVHKILLWSHAQSGHLVWWQRYIWRLGLWWNMWYVGISVIVCMYPIIPYGQCTPSYDTIIAVTLSYYTA